MSYNKYRAKKVTLDGIVFASKKEAKRYTELKALEAAGQIQELELQKKYLLIPSQREPDTIGPKGRIKKGKVIERECAYVADFVYREVIPFCNASDCPQIVEDTKGKRTKDYIIKRKLMLYIHGIRIKEV